MISLHVILNKHNIEALDFSFSIAPPRLLFTLSGPYIRRVDLDGLRVLNLYTGGTPRAIDFDHRYNIVGKAEC